MGLRSLHQVGGRCGLRTTKHSRKREKVILYEIVISAREPLIVVVATVPDTSGTSILGALFPSDLPSGSAFCENLCDPPATLCVVDRPAVECTACTP